MIVGVVTKFVTLTDLFIDDEPFKRSFYLDKYLIGNFLFFFLREIPSQWNNRNEYSKYLDVRYL